MSSVTRSLIAILQITMQVDDSVSNVTILTTDMKHNYLPNTHQSRSYNSVKISQCRLYCLSMYLNTFNRCLCIHIFLYKNIEQVEIPIRCLLFQFAGHLVYTQTMLCEACSMPYLTVCY